MFLYWLPAERRFVHRQSDIPKGVSDERLNVPTDIVGLMGFLNEVVTSPRYAQSPPEAVEAPPAPAEVEAPIEAPEEPQALPAAIPRPMDAGAVLSRLDSPGVDVEGVVEAIAKAKGYALRRYAGAVAVRFQELAS